MNRDLLQFWQQFVSCLNCWITQLEMFDGVDQFLRKLTNNVFDSVFHLKKKMFQFILHRELFS